MPEPVDVVRLRAGLTPGEALAWDRGYDTAREEFEADHDQQTRLEAKLDALILALKSGAIGRWQ